MSLAFHVQPGTEQKIEILGRAAQHDLCGEACGTAATRTRNELDRWIYPAAMPDGTRVNLLKVLLTNACEKNCGYCANRVGRDVRRTQFGAEELARSFDEMQRRGLVKGLFLSSGICGGAERTMDRMIATVELIRRRYQFAGYVHLKLLPGASRSQVERAGQIAQRVSVNLEAPSSQRLLQIAPHKARDEIVNPLRWASEFLQKGCGEWAPAGQTTQFVVGAADESDREILATTSYLYSNLHLRRAYFSAFQPIQDTPLEDRPATPLWREHRLYQSDFLFRLYGFRLDELIFDDSGCLPREADPKAMWAQSHPEFYPIEVNRASREALLRVPGIGPRSAGCILRARHESRFTSLRDLQKAGAVAYRAGPYVLLNGRRPAYQLSLW